MTAIELFEILKQNIEGQSTIHPDGQVWNVVYLPNAQGSLTRQQFGGMLSSLKKKGVYMPVDIDFGEVRVQ